MVVKVTLHVIQWIVEIFSIFGFRKRKSFKPQGVMQDESSLIAAVEFLSNHGIFTYSVAWIFSKRNGSVIDENHSYISKHSLMCWMD